MLQNGIAGLQGIIDHTLVGHLVGHQANAAIGVIWQIFLVVVVFISSLFSGMGVLVARFAGAGEAEKVNRVVYQAFLTAVILACLILAPIGYFFAPQLLDLVRAAPAVKAEALPYLRIMFVFSFGMLIFFMLGGALRAAGDARTPLRLGVMMTALNLTLNVIFAAERSVVGDCFRARHTRDAVVFTLPARKVDGDTSRYDLKNTAALAFYPDFALYAQNRHQMGFKNYRKIGVGLLYVQN